MRKSVLRCSGVGLVLLLRCLTLPSRTMACVVGTGTGVSCTESALNACLPGGGSFDGTVTFTCGGAATITVTRTKTISADTTIDGGSLITISGRNRVGVFSVNTGVTFTVENLTIANGYSGYYGFGRIDGAGIYNTGTLAVTNSTFSGNSADWLGGGILNNGTLAVTESTFSGNSGGLGGGIASCCGGTLTVTDSTFSDNSGGGIWNTSSRVTVTNSTFSGNSATNQACGNGGICDGEGGGIFNDDGPLTVTNSSFSGNRGGGIANCCDGTLMVTNTIVANSTSGGNCSGSVADGGHNIDDGTTCGFTGTGCTGTSGSSFCNTSPQLDPAGLQNNGGPTQTIGLQAGSPAVNAGDPDVCANPPVNGVDQRGYVRLGTGYTNCSIGAYEYNSPGPPPPCTGDCRVDGRVTVDELLTMVNIVLGNAEMSECERADDNDDGLVTVDEILTAVTNGLNGCGGG